MDRRIGLVASSDFPMCFLVLLNVIDQWKKSDMIQGGIYLRDDVPEIDAAIFRGRRLYQELPAPAINHINGRDNTALRTALINNTFSFT
ncbi:hypothetical protein C0J52_26438 [Blattella germanica]|nr:hypothetical protein C0J52_26438 [Blattella germanica]